MKRHGNRFCNRQQRDYIKKMTDFVNEHEEYYEDDENWAEIMENGVRLEEWDGICDGLVQMELKEHDKEITEMRELITFNEENGELEYELIYSIAELSPYDKAFQISNVTDSQYKQLDIIDEFLYKCNYTMDTTTIHHSFENGKEYVESWFDDGQHFLRWLEMGLHNKQIVIENIGINMTYNSLDIYVTESL